MHWEGNSETIDGKDAFNLWGHIDDRNYSKNYK